VIFRLFRRRRREAAPKPQPASASLQIVDRRLTARDSSAQVPDLRLAQGLRPGERVWFDGSGAGFAGVADPARPAHQSLFTAYGDQQSMPIPNRREV
jgi:hypothetical protein